MQAAFPLANRKTRKILKYLLFAAAGVLLLVFAALFSYRIWVKRAIQVSLPQLDGQLKVAGVSAPVTVRRDVYGVPYIQAASIRDAIFAQGYVTAQDRLWQMDMLRRHAAGELAEVIGSSMLAHDRLQRYLQIRSAADAALPLMEPAQMQSLQAYADGVNAFLSSHQDTLPVEFRVLRYKPKPWTPRDTLLVAFSMVQELNTSFPTKLNREVLTARLKPELLTDLYPVGSWRDHPPTRPSTDLTAPQQDIPDIPLDESQTRLDLSPQHTTGLLALQRTLSLFSSHAGCESCTAGSNNWAVAGSHTASGKPLLSNDMHLGLQIPGIWYQASMEAPGLHVSGVTLPGAPFVVVGHNDHIAWGFTAMLGDVQDVYLEKFRPGISNPKSYEYQAADGSWQAVTSRVETVHVLGGRDVEMTVGFTRHGSMLTPIITPAVEHEKRPLALAWTIYDASIAGNLPFLAVNQAANWEQFYAAFRSFGGPTLNAVYADDQGHIGYHAVGKIPIRGDAAHPSGLSPVPVTDASYNWSGYVPYDLMPQAFDPASGVLATANARVSADDSPFSLTLDWENPYRNERIWKRLESAQGLKPADMLALQMDIYSEMDRVMAQRIAYAIDHSSTKDKRVHQAADILRTWNGEMDAKLAAPAIVAATREALWPMLLQPVLGKDWELYRWGEKAFVQEELVTHTPARWLPSKYANWSELLTAAVSSGLSANKAPNDLAKWQYGKTHVVEVEHPIFGRSAIGRKLFPGRTGSGIHPLSGNSLTLRAGSRTFGPSERFTADLSGWDQSTLNIVLGQSGNPASPNFNDQWSEWYEGSTRALPFSAEAVRAATRHTLTLLP